MTDTTQIPRPRQPRRPGEHRRRRPRAGPAARPPTASGASTRSTRRTPQGWTPRRCAASTATWCWSAGSTPRPPRCSARASWASGPACSARRRPRSAPGGRCRPQDYAFPTYREHGVAWCRGVDPLNLLGLFRGVNHGGWDPDEKNFHLYTIVIGAQTLHATGYAMGIQRDGDVGTATRAATPRSSPTSATARPAQGDVNEAFVFATRAERPRRLLLPEQPVGDLRAQRQADPGAALPAGQRLRLPRRPGRRQRRGRGLRGDQGGAGPRPRGQRPDLRRGLHLPDGRAHDVRRPDPVPGRGRGRGLEAARPDRPAADLPGARGA